MTKYKAAATAVLIGLIGLMPLLRNPRFQAIHTVDVVQLLASGACFGVALSNVFASRRNQSGPGNGRV